MTRLGLVIEANRCIGCNVCVMACKDEFVGNDYLPLSAAQPDTTYGFGPSNTYGWPNTPSSSALWLKPGHSWMNDTQMILGKFPRVKTAYVAQPCMHCASAPCQKAAANNAVYTRADGIVIIDPVKSVGQKQIMSACPYGRIYWNESLNIPQKCTLCAHLVDQGKNPKCVDVCPYSAIHFGDLSDPNSDVSKFVSANATEALHPEYGTNPNVFYVGLPKPFLSGKVVSGKTGEYIGGAQVQLSSSDGTTATTSTDNYADFEFKDLRAGVVYMLQVSAAGMYPKKLVVYLDKAKDVGKVPLSPS